MRDVIGQRRFLEKLGEQAIRGDVAHAYELSGPRSIGKNTVALRLAQTLNCTAEPRIAGGTKALHLRKGVGRTCMRMDRASAQYHLSREALGRLVSLIQIVVGNPSSSPARMRRAR